MRFPHSLVRLKGGARRKLAKSRTQYFELVFNKYNKYTSEPPRLVSSAALHFLLERLDFVIFSAKYSVGSLEGSADGGEGAVSKVHKVVTEVPTLYTLLTAPLPPSA